MDKRFYFPYIWVERKYRPQCQEYAAPATGIRLTYDKGIDPLLIEQTESLLKYLRKNYYFPIRVNVIISDDRRYHAITDGHIYYGAFYHNADAYPNRIIYPSIAVAGQLWKYKSIEDVHIILLHELTHYFQWFFAEETKRTDRSLEMEANWWAYYILNSFNEEGRKKK